MEKQRRDFLKITAASAAGLALTRRSNMALAAWPGTGTMAVNPASTTCGLLRATTRK